ncbi:MAG: hypothetical protein NXI20_28270 [bacterium]|nr:hypothetical protein [bacterium]
MKVLRLLFAIAVLGTTFYACAPEDEVLEEVNTNLEQVSTDNNEDEDPEPPQGPSGS